MEQGYANLLAGLRKLATEEVAKNRTAGPQVVSQPEGHIPGVEGKTAKGSQAPGWRSSLPAKRMEWWGNT